MVDGFQAGREEEVFLVERLGQDAERCKWLK